MRDSQRSRVYAWERSQAWWVTAWRGGYFGRSPNSVVRPLTLPECEKFLSRVMRRDKAYEIEIGDGRGRQSAAGWDWKVALPVWARTKPVMLHEAAHVIAAQRGVGDRHGPIFARIYIDLLARYLHLRPSDLLRSARAAGVKVAPRNRTGGGAKA